MRKSKAAEAEDRMLAGEIAKAHAFSAFLQRGQADRLKITIEEAGPSGYAKARLAADELNRQSQFGRGAIVYAINRIGSFPVDENLARLAGLIA